MGPSFGPSLGPSQDLIEDSRKSGFRAPHNQSSHAVTCKARDDRGPSRGRLGYGLGIRILIGLLLQYLLRFYHLPRPRVGCC